MTVWYIMDTFSKSLALCHRWFHSQRSCTLPWRRDERDCVSNHQPRDCLLNSLFRRRSKKTSKLRVTGLCEGNSPVTGVFPAQGPVMRKMFPFDGVIMTAELWCLPDQAVPCTVINPILLTYLLNKLLTKQYIDGLPHWSYCSLALNHRYRATGYMRRIDAHVT